MVYTALNGQYASAKRIATSQGRHTMSTAHANCFGARIWMPLIDHFQSLSITILTSNRFGPMVMFAFVLLLTDELTSSATKTKRLI
jgi:hypothetical protein